MNLNLLRATSEVPTPPWWVVLSATAFVVVITTPIWWAWLKTLPSKAVGFFTESEAEYAQRMQLRAQYRGDRDYDEVEDEELDQSEGQHIRPNGVFGSDMEI